MKGIKMQKGITLIALIITIIVLLILAMIAISVIQDSDILVHADRSAIMHEVGTISEKIRLESQAIKLEDAADDTGLEQNVENALEKLYGNNADPELIEIDFNQPITSIPEGIKEGENYYIAVPEYLKYDISRGKGFDNDPITGDIFVVDEKFNVYYLITVTEQPIVPPRGTLPDDGILETIGAIEDLVDFAMAVNSGNTFEGKTVTLETSLNFEDENSYRMYTELGKDPKATIYTKDGVEIDANGDDDKQPIMTEMIGTKSDDGTKSGVGFYPIGKTDMNTGETGPSFKGNFDGKGNSINNLYINRPDGMASFFGAISTNSTIKDLTINNPELKGMASIGIATVVDFTTNSNDTIVIENCHVKGGNIGEVNEKSGCISVYTNGLALIFTPGANVNICNSSNSSKLEGVATCGIANIMAKNSNIHKCVNTGEIGINPQNIEFYRKLMDNDTFEIFMSAGCICNRAYESSVIKECENYGNITEYEYDVAGVCITSGGNIQGCNNYGNLNIFNPYGTRYAGVVVDCGDDVLIDIKQSNNYGKINIVNEMEKDRASAFSLGGIYSGRGTTTISLSNNMGDIELVGNLTNDSSENVEIAGIATDVNEINSCINKGNITISNKSTETTLLKPKVSGISSGGHGNITNCCNYGNLTINNIDNGIAAGISTNFSGQTITSSAITASVDNCYNVGDIKANFKVSGIIITETGGFVRNTYNEGTLTSDNPDCIITQIGGDENRNQKCYTSQDILTLGKESVRNSLNTDQENGWFEWDINSENGYIEFKR